MDVLEISAIGIASLKGFPRLIEVLNKGMDTDDDHHQQRLEAAKRRAILAASEENSDFSTLHGFGVVALWSWLESFVLDLVILWIAKRPSSFYNTASPKIKLNAVDLLQLKGIDKAKFIVEALDRETSGPMRAGFGRFEQLLKTIGFEIQLDEAHKRDLYEFQKVRNCLAHRNGIADAKFKSECPWLNAKVGKPLRVSRHMMQKYSDASGHLLLKCLICAGTKFGVDLTDYEQNDGATALTRVAIAKG